MFMLFNIIVSVAIGIVDAIVGTMANGIGLLGLVYSLAVLLPSLALGARRLHDIDRSGWWQLLVFIPVVGWIVLIVWAVTEGGRGANRFGADPKTDEGDGVPVLA